MDDKHFHNVNPDVLKKITVNEILAGEKIALDKIDYSVPVPTQSQHLPSRSRDTWQQVEWGGLDVASLPEWDSGYRGRLGGC